MSSRQSIAVSAHPTYVESRKQAARGVILGDAGIAAAAIGLLVTSMTGIISSPFLWVSYVGWGAAAGGYAFLTRHLVRWGEQRDALGYGLDSASFAMVALAGACLPFAPRLAIVFHVLGSLLILTGLCVPDRPGADADLV